MEHFYTRCINKLSRFFFYCGVWFVKCLHIIWKQTHFSFLTRDTFALSLVNVAALDMSCTSDWWILAHDFCVQTHKNTFVAIIMSDWTLNTILFKMTSFGEFFHLACPPFWMLTRKRHNTQLSLIWGRGLIDLNQLFLLLGYVLFFYTNQ